MTLSHTYSPSTSVYLFRTNTLIWMELSPLVLEGEVELCECSIPAALDKLNNKVHLVSGAGVEKGWHVEYEMMSEGSRV